VTEIPKQLRCENRTMFIVNKLKNLFVNYKRTLLKKIFASLYSIIINFAQFKSSRPISRVLSWTVIYLGLLLPAGSRGLT